MREGLINWGIPGIPQKTRIMKVCISIFVAFAFDNGCHILSLGTDGMTAFCTGKQVDNEGGKFGSTSDYCVKNAKCKSTLL